MTRGLVGVVALASLLAAASDSEAKSRALSLRALSFEDRCAVARVLAHQVKDMGEWMDKDKFNILKDNAIDLLITDADQLGHDDQMPSLFASGEKCAFSLSLAYELGKLPVAIRLAAGRPPPSLPDGKTYALLFASDLQPGKRWLFEWPLNRRGYGGCSIPDGGVAVCGGLNNIRTSMPTIKIVVARTKGGKGFEAQQASIDMVKYSEP